MPTRIAQQDKDCVEDTYRGDFNLPRQIYNHCLHKNNPIVHGSQNINTCRDKDIDGYRDCHSQQSNN